MQAAELFGDHLCGACIAALKRKQKYDFCPQEVAILMGEPTVTQVNQEERWNLVAFHSQDAMCSQGIVKPGSQ